MVNAQKSVLPQVEGPKPITPVKVRRADAGRRLIKFHATQEAIREIRRKGYGILNQKPESGWCVLVVNDCYPFNKVVRWMKKLQSNAVTEEMIEDAA